MRLCARTHIKYYLGVILFVALFTGCEEPVGKSSYESMSIELILPAGEMFAPNQSPAMRVLGDPGSEELFAIPEYAYIFVVLKEKNQDPTISYIHYDGENKLDRNKWEKTTYTNDDQILQYSEKVIVNIPPKEKRDYATIYMAVSDVPLTLSTTTPASEAAIKDITFTTSGIESHFQNIYSSPCKYPSEEAYYGKVTNYMDATVPVVSMMLYHVAAKVDLMWNVAEAKRGNVKISYIAVEHLYDGQCYLFKPTENSIGNYEINPSGYSKVLVNENPPSPGTQWNGRAYFYAIPYKNNDVDGESNPNPHYPLQLRLQKGGDSPSDVSGTKYYSKIVKTEIPDVWTSWIRAQISINSETYNSVIP